MASTLELDLSDTDRTVHQAFEHMRRLIPDNPFIEIPAVSPGGPLQLTYSQAAVHVDELSALYRNAGYGARHHVALLLESRAEFYLHWLALNKIGATLVPIASDLVDQEMGLVLQHGEVDLLVCIPGRLEIARRAGAHIPGLQIAGLGPSGEAIPRAREPVATTEINCAAIVFTSGSTGRPKGCLLSNEYLLTFGRWYRDMGGRCALRPGLERFITPLPPNHVNALAFSSMGAITTGGCIIQLDRFRSDQWWNAVRQTGATVMHYLGVMPGMLLKLPPHPFDRQHDLRFGIGGGVRGTDHHLFEERFGVPLLEAWAMTETGGAGTISTHSGPRHVGEGCIGQPSPKYSEVAIVDESLNPLPPGSVGELVTRATGTDPQRGFFSGYYRDPEATQAAWAGGWLHSGDLARRDESGSIFFLGRRKQIIRRSGENISAMEVESALSSMEHVRQVAIVPVPDELREEEVFACIVAGAALPPNPESVDELLRHASKFISYFKLPGYIAFVPNLPTTATQKLRYGAIIELAQGLLSARGPQLFDVRKSKRLYRTAQ